MKLTYKRKISKNDRWAFGAALLLIIVFFVVDIYLDRIPNMWGIFWIPYTIFFIYIYYIRPVAKITEKKKLVFPHHCVDVHQVFSLEEGGKKGLKVRYNLNDMERVTFIPVTDEDRPRLIEDLLKINPGIEVKLEEGFNVQKRVGQELF